MENIVIEDILRASLGESGSKIRATFKKTINIKQYESESIEAETVLEIEEGLTGAERVLLSAILQAQMEYTAFVAFLAKGQVTQAEFNQRRAELEGEIAILKGKAEMVTGKSMDKYIQRIGGM